MSDTIKHLVFNEQGLIGMGRNCQKCQRWPLRIHTKFELKACFKCLFMCCSNVMQVNLSNENKLTIY